MRSISLMKPFFLPLLLSLLLLPYTATGVLSSTPEPNLLREGDYAVYIGYLPFDIVDKPAHTSYMSLNTDLKVGPWLVEWCVVRDYGSIDVVLVHVFYRVAKLIYTGEEITIPGKSKGKPKTAKRQGDTILMFSPTSYDHLHKVYDYEKEFLVVLDENNMSIIDDKMRVIASWIFLAHPKTYLLASLLSQKGATIKNIPSNVTPPFILKGYYVSPKPVYWEELLARTWNNTYLLLSPRKQIIGPLSLIEVIWGLRGKKLVQINASSIVPSKLHELVLKDLKEIGVASAPVFPERFFAPFMRAVYEASTGLALIYGTIVDPMVVIASGFNASKVLVEEGVGSEYADWLSFSENVRDILGKLNKGPERFYISYGLMHLYTSSLIDLDSKVYANVSAPRIFDEFIDYAVSKSLFVNGCKPEEIDARKVEFVGRWSWKEVVEKFAPRNSTTRSPITTTIITISGQGHGGNVYMYVLLAAVILLAVGLWVARSGKGKSIG